MSFRNIKGNNRDCSQSTAFSLISNLCQMIICFSHVAFPCNIRGLSYLRSEPLYILNTGYAIVRFAFDSDDFKTSARIINSNFIPVVCYFIYPTSQLTKIRVFKRRPTVKFHLICSFDLLEQSGKPSCFTVKLYIQNVFMQVQSKLTEIASLPLVNFCPTDKTSPNSTPSFANLFCWQ